MTHALHISPAVPTREQIKARLLYKAGLIRLLPPAIVDRLVDAFAEETERMLLRTATAAIPQPPVVRIRMQRLPDRDRMIKYAGYTCPNCQRADLKTSDKYCCSCGVEVCFTEAPERVNANSFQTIK